MSRWWHWCSVSDAVLLHGVDSCVQVVASVRCLMTAMESRTWCLAMPVCTSTSRPNTRAAPRTRLDSHVSCLKVFTTYDNCLLMSPRTSVPLQLLLLLLPAGSWLEKGEGREQFLIGKILGAQNLNLAL